MLRIDIRDFEGNPKNTNARKVLTQKGRTTVQKSTDEIA